MEKTEQVLTEKVEEKSASDFMSNKKAAGSVSFVMGIVVLVIVVAIVAIPIINEAVVNLSGTQKTIVGVTGTLLAVLIIVFIANAM